MNLRCTGYLYEKFYGDSRPMFTECQSYPVVEETEYSYHVLDKNRRVRVIGKDKLGFIIANDSTTMKPVPPMWAKFEVGGSL